jgi:hypothetical protein
MLLQRDKYLFVYRLQVVAAPPGTVLSGSVATGMTLARPPVPGATQTNTYSTIRLSQVEP